MLSLPGHWLLSQVKVPPVMSLPPRLGPRCGVPKVTSRLTPSWPLLGNGPTPRPGATLEPFAIGVPGLGVDFM